MEMKNSIDYYSNMMKSFKQLSAWLEGLFGLHSSRSFLWTKQSYVEIIKIDGKISILVVKNEEEVNDVKSSRNFHKSICEPSISSDLVVVEVALLVYFKFPIEDGQMCEKYENLGSIRCDDNELNKKIDTALEKSCPRRKPPELKAVNASEVANASFNQILQRDWKHKKSYFTVHMVHKIAQLVRYDDDDPMINYGDIRFHFLFPTHVDSRFYKSLLLKSSVFDNSTSIILSHPNTISTDESISTSTNLQVNLAILAQPITKRIVQKTAVSYMHGDVGYDSKLHQDVVVTNRLFGMNFETILVSKQANVTKVVFSNILSIRSPILKTLVEENFPVFPLNHKNRTLFECEHPATVCDLKNIENHCFDNMSISYIVKETEIRLAVPFEGKTISSKPCHLSKTIEGNVFRTETFHLVCPCFLFLNNIGNVDISNFDHVHIQSIDCVCQPVLSIKMAGFTNIQNTANSGTYQYELISSENSSSILSLVSTKNHTTARHQIFLPLALEEITFSVALGNSMYAFHVHTKTGPISPVLTVLLDRPLFSRNVFLCFNDGFQYEIAKFRSIFYSTNYSKHLNSTSMQLLSRQLEAFIVVKHDNRLFVFCAGLDDRKQKHAKTTQQYNNMIKIRPKLHYYIFCSKLSTFIDVTFGRFGRHIFVPEIRVEHIAQQGLVVSLSAMCWSLKERNLEIDLEPIVYDNDVEINIFIGEIVDENQFHMPSLKIGDILLKNALPNKLGQVLLQLESLMYLKKIDAQRQLQLQPLAVFINDDVRLLVLMPESSVRPLLYKVERNGMENLVNFRLFDSLVVRLLVGLDDAGFRVYFMLLLVEFFVYRRAFNSVSIVFKSEVIEFVR